MNIGLVGSGGREHALAIQLAKKRPQDNLTIFASHFNPGMVPFSDNFIVGELGDIHSIKNTFQKFGVELAIVGPETPLMLGVVDILRENGILTFGPTRSQARLEGDKSFMRNLLEQRVGWGSPRWLLVTPSNFNSARSFIEEVGQVAVKPLGLTAGKGVRVMGVHLRDASDALADAQTWLQRDGSVLLEERLIGEEFSRMVMVSGDQIAPLPVAQDFKYALDGDRGGMTGGMGAYTMADGTLPFLLADDLASADRLIKDVVGALALETGQPYRGFLYGQFMATAKGVRLIEFNTRLGDPEGINIMSLLENDIPEILLQAASGDFQPGSVHSLHLASVVKYMVPMAYPESGPAHPFHFDEKAVSQAGLSLICASVKKVDMQWVTLGSRTLALCGLGQTPGEVSQRIETLLQEMEPAGLRHRRDIGCGIILQEKISRMNRIREGKGI